MYIYITPTYPIETVQHHHHHLRPWESRFLNHTLASSQLERLNKIADWPKSLTADNDEGEGRSDLVLTKTLFIANSTRNMFC